jgi:F-box and leucine-rich repeat protein GRR1
MFAGGEYFSPSLERVHLSYCVNLTLTVRFALSRPFE